MTVNKPLLRLQLAIAIATCCHSDLEIEEFLEQFAKPKSSNKTVLDAAGKCSEQSPIGPEGDLTHAPAQRNQVTSSPNASDQVRESSVDIQRLQKESVLQRQEIIGLRLLLLQASGQLGNLSSCLPSSVPTKRPHEPTSIIANDATKKQKNASRDQKSAPVEELENGSTAKTKTSREINNRMSDEPEPRLDTFSRVICLDQLLRQAVLSDSSDIFGHLITLDSLGRAAIGLLETVCYSLQQLSKNAFESNQPRCASPGRVIDGITITLNSSLKPVLHENVFIAKFSEGVKEIYFQRVLPKIHQRIEALFEQILMTIKRCCEHLSVLFLKPPKHLQPDIEKLLQLRDELLRLALGFARQSGDWLGYSKVNLIKILVNQLATSYLAAEQTYGGSETIGYLVEIINSFCRDSSRTTYNELELKNIRESIGKMMLDERYSSKKGVCSLIVSRAVDRTLMRLWSL